MMAGMPPWGSSFWCPQLTNIRAGIGADSSRVARYPSQIFYSDPPAMMGYRNTSANSMTAVLAPSVLRRRFHRYAAAAVIIPPRHQEAHDLSEPL